MTEQVQRWTVGGATITSVVEDQTDGIPPALFFPAATDEVVRRHDWLRPHYADAGGNIGLRVQALVVQLAGRTAVIDPCVGNGRSRSSPFWNDQRWPFMERFLAAGFDPGQVDLVVHTHLHTDHVGWGTHRVDGRWVPTFPRARYIYVEAELDWLRSRIGDEDDPDAGLIYADSIAPVLDAGLGDTVPADADLGGGLRLLPTFGHTPAHTSLRIEAAGEQALVTGDAIHHPVQLAEPALAFVSDDRSDLAREARDALVDQAARSGILTIGSHFPTLPAGHVVADGAVWRFEPRPGN